MRFGRVLALVGGGLALCIALLLLAVFVTRDEDNIQADNLLAERFKITQAVGRYKAEVGLPPADPTREDQQIARLRALAIESGLDPAFTEKFLRFIVDEVILHHKRIAAG